MTILRSVSVCAILLGATGTLAPIAKAQLANDECTGSVHVLDGSNGPYDTTGATTSAPAWPCAGGGNDLWFLYVATCTGSLTVDTCGAGYDTAIELFDAACGPCPNFVGGVCNDDFCGFQSSAVIAVTQGSIIFIRVGGYNSATGPFSLNIVCGSTLAPDDECTGATPVTIGVNAGLDTVNYTSSSTWPCAAGGGSDRWFSFTPRCAGSYTFDTCSGARTFDTAIELLQGPCPGTCGSPASIICNDDSCSLGSSVTANLIGGAPYLIRVGGYGAAQGFFDLTITQAGSGSYSVAFPGCGGNTITTTGSPNIGGAVNYTMGPVQGLAQMWVGITPLNVPLCSAGCVLGSTIDTPIPGNVIAGPIPCDPTLINAQFYVQGIDLGAPGGCTNSDPLGLAFTTSDTIFTTIGN